LSTRGRLVVLLIGAGLGCAQPNLAPPITTAGALPPAAMVAEPSSESPRPSATTPSLSPSNSPPPSCEARRGRDGLRRAAVVRTLDGGLGRWLQQVDVDPKLEHGRFRGWIIRTLPAGDACYADLDLRAGDVVTRINGRPVERPEEASDVWDGLRTSSALVVDFTRSGQPHTLRFKIVEP
jgi:S1-C subfamily serine protease